MTDRFECVDDRTVKDTQHALAGVCYTSFECLLYISHRDAVKILNRRERELRDSREAVAELVEVVEEYRRALSGGLAGRGTSTSAEFRVSALVAKHKIDGGADE